MAKSSIYFLSIVFLMIQLSCTKREWYQKDLSESVRKQYAVQLGNGASYRNYQGTVAEQMHHFEALAMDSSNGDLWRELGTARVKRGILDEMYHYYEGGVQRKPAKWAGFRGYLYLYFYRDFERAIADFNYNDEVVGEVTHSQGQDHDYMRGIAYYGLKEFEEALRYLNIYIDRVEKDQGSDWVDVYAYLYKGLTLMKLDRNPEAIEAFDDVLKNYPKLADAYYHKAKIYAEQGEQSKAWQELEKAEEYFQMGYFHQRPYVEVLDQIYSQDIADLKQGIFSDKNTAEMIRKKRTI